MVDFVSVEMSQDPLVARRQVTEDRAKAILETGQIVVDEREDIRNG
jgi:hypothetical protein